MEKISLYLKLLCLVSILAGILTALIPEGGIKKAYLSLSAVVLLSAAVFPLKLSYRDDFNFSFADQQQASENLSIEIASAEKKIYEDLISQETEKKLSEAGIKAGISVLLESKNENVTVKEINVIGDFTDEEKTMITDMLSADFKEVQIIFSGG